MKKRNIIISLATLGVVAAVGSSVALYVVSPEDKTINIGVRTDADVNYQFSTVATTAVGGETIALSPDTDLQHEFKIAGIKNSGTTFTQNSVLAELSVKITPTDAELAQYLVPNLRIHYGEGTYFDGTTNLNTIEVSTGNDEGKNVWSVNEGVITGSIKTYIECVDSVENGNVVDLTVSLSDTLMDENFINLYDGESYNVELTLNQPTDYNKAYLVGTMNNWTTLDDKYQMVGDIDGAFATGWQWIWEGTIEFPDGNRVVKGVKEDFGRDLIWSQQDITVPEDNTVYHWTGNAGDDIWF